MISNELAKRIQEDALRKVALEHFNQFNEIFMDGSIPKQCYRFVAQILSLSGTTEVECPECHGEKGFVSTSESLGGSLPGWSDCASCNGMGATKHEWEIGVHLKNGELPQMFQLDVTGMDAAEKDLWIERSMGVVEGQKSMLNAGYRQVVPKGE